MKWEDTLGLEQRPQAGGVAAVVKQKSDEMLADTSVHGFLTANYGSALRHAAESGLGKQVTRRRSTTAPHGEPCPSSSSARNCARRRGEGEMKGAHHRRHRRA